jgi:hypothetical protein
MFQPQFSRRHAFAAGILRRIADTASIQHYRELRDSRVGTEASPSFRTRPRFWSLGLLLECGERRGCHVLPRPDSEPD